MCFTAETMLYAKHIPGPVEDSEISLASKEDLMREKDVLLDKEVLSVWEENRVLAA